MGSISIDKSIADEFEAINGAVAKNKNDQNAIGLLLESTVFHEATHYGDLNNNNMLVHGYVDEKGNIHPTYNKGGKLFESAAYVDDIGWHNYKIMGLKIYGNKHESNVMPQDNFIMPIKKKL